MSWKKVKLGEVCKIEKGNIGILKAVAGEFPLVVTGEERKSHNEYQFDDEAVIIPLVSSTGHGHKSLKRIHYQEGKFSVGNILCAVIPKDKSVLNAHYLYRYLDLNKENELVARMKGMANVTLPMKEIADIDIPLPNIEEQFKFVEKINSVEEIRDDISTELTHQLTLVKKLRQQILQDAVQGRFDFAQRPEDDEPASELLKKIKATLRQAQGDKKGKKQKELPPIKPEEIPFEIPENWVWCRLGEIIEYSENLDIQKHLSPGTIINYVDIDAIDNQNFVIREAKQKTVSELSTRARRILKPNYIVYSTVRPYLKNIAIVEDEKDNYIGSTGFNVFKTLDVELKYVFYYLLTPYVNNSFQDLMVGFNSPSITNVQFEESLFPLPPLSEQTRIVQKLDELMQYCNDLEASIKQSESQNEKLLQQVLREALSQPRDIRGKEQVEAKKK